MKCKTHFRVGGVVFLFLFLFFSMQIVALDSPFV